MNTQPSVKLEFELGDDGGVTSVVVIPVGRFTVEQPAVAGEHPAPPG